MCNNNESNNECRCIAEILTTINILQNNAENNDSCLDSCDRGFLVCSVSSCNCNTRPIMLYTCCGNGIPWSMPVIKDNIVCTVEQNGLCSSVFRIEKIDGCCATFRVLANNPDNTDGCFPYVATNSFFTMNLNCVCSIRCLNDTFIDCI